MTDTETAADLAFVKQRYDDAVPLDDLEPWPGNPRLHAADKIRDSVAVNGFAGAVYVQESSSRIIGGHGRVNDLLAAGGTTVPVIWLDVDDDTAARLVLSLNSTGDAATYEDRDLADFLESFGDSEVGLLGTGFDDDFLAGLQSGIEGDDLSAESQLTDIQYRVMIMCGDESEQTTLLKRFIDEGLTVTALMI